jgi:hypothetical protein
MKVIALERSDGGSNRARVDSFSPDSVKLDPLTGR